MNVTLLSIGQAALLIGVCTKTLRRWDGKGLLKAAFRTKGNHRRYDRKQVLDLRWKEEKGGILTKDTTCVLYGRVSSSRQKKSGDLIRQIDGLRHHAEERDYKVFKSYSDVGSGLNDKRKGLLRLLMDASLGMFDVVIVNYNDRLARFGLQVIKEYLKSWNVTLEVIHPTIIDASPHAEMITNLTSILYSFMGKLYRLRRS